MTRRDEVFFIVGVVVCTIMALVFVPEFVGPQRGHLWMNMVVFIAIGFHGLITGWAVYLIVKEIVRIRA